MHKIISNTPNSTSTFDILGDSEMIRIVRIESVDGQSSPMRRITAKIKIRNWLAECKLELPLPRINSQFDAIEHCGMRWVATSRYFEDSAIKGLQDAYVGALVGIGYPPETTMDNLILIDRWLRLAFYADKIIDTLLAHSPHKITQLRNRIFQVLNGQDRCREMDSPLVKGLYEVYFDCDFFRKFLFVKESFFECLEKNEEEALLRIGNNIPDESSIEKIRIKSCGGYHCILIGAAALGIDATYYLRNFPLLGTMLEQVSLCTGWSNDLVSANSEHIEAITALSRMSSPEETKLNFHSLNLVLSHIESIDDATGTKTLQQKIQEAVTHVATKFNREVSEFYKFKNQLITNDSFEWASDIDKTNIYRFVDIMERWIETTTWGLTARRYSGNDCTNQTILSIINQIQSSQ